MSGHNPHGRLGQPNNSWNHLQVPSYIPRQPQLAHMSNERPMVRSPLTWHTPTTSDPIFSYMANNHKNSLDMNLPFVRDPSAPFGSVDLSFSSAARNNSSSPRNLHSPVNSNPSSLSEFSCGIIPNTKSSSTTASAPNPGVIQSTASAKEKMQNSKSTNNGEIIPTSCSGGGLYVRDARQINNELAILAARDQISAALLEPMELVKEPLQHSIKAHQLPVSPKHKSPTRTLLSTQDPSCKTSPPTTHMETDKNFHSHRNQAIVTSSEEPSHVPPAPTVDTVDGQSQVEALGSHIPPQAAANEDSVDSSASSKKRRKRKPNKPIRMSNDSDTESVLPNSKEAEIICFDKTNNRSELTEVSSKTDCIEHSKDKNDKVQESDVNTKVNVEENSDKNGETFHSNSSTQDRSSLQKNVNNNNDTGPSTNQQTSTATEDSSKNSPNLTESVSALPVNNDNDSKTTVLASPRRRGRRKDDSEDETIDKIAAMIASTEGNDDVVSLPLNTEDKDKNEDDNLTAILDSSQDIDHGSTKEKSYEEVENKLEEMFAGIEDDRPACKAASPVPSTSQSMSGAQSDVLFERGNESITESPIKMTSKKLNGGNKRSNSVQKEDPPKKKKKLANKKGASKSAKNKKNGKTNKNKHIIASKESKIRKEEPSASIELIQKYRGPFIHIKTDGTSQVVNTPMAEEDSESKPKFKKTYVSQTASDRNKIRGLHVSTLSMKYDADTTDKTWICVFCKTGPHKTGLGDLFGPYIVTTTCEDFQFSQAEPNDDLFKSKRTKTAMIQRRLNPMTMANSDTANSIAPGIGSATNKKKRKLSEPQASTSALSSSTSVSAVVASASRQLEPIDIFYGMTKAGESSYEVWMHEDCAVWAPGVHIVGTRIVGLESSVWNCSRHKCNVCGNHGAMLSCLQRGCAAEVHLPCARQGKWQLCNDNFKSFCEKHWHNNVVDS